MVVLVTGANGQLGQALQSIVENYPSIDFVFCSSSELDITNRTDCETVFQKHQPDFCINAAAYTAVDKAESEIAHSKTINEIGAKNLAEVCKKHNTVLLHISTDFVFDGTSIIPYLENDIPNPQSVYGQTKLDGEIGIQATWEKHFIIRTSWVYSEFGSNFMKTMLRLASERDNLSVVSDQIGTPTYAVDLADAILCIITDYSKLNADHFGIYNFSNEGHCSWYEFAKEIFIQKGITIDLKPIPTSAYPTPAKRPMYSVLDKTKIKNIFGMGINDWKTSLKACLKH